MRSIFIFLATLFTSVSLPAQQFRAAWADVFHVGMGSASEVDAMVNSLVTGHHNAVVVQVLGYMDNGTPSHGAHWKSSIVPWSSRVTATFDPLAYLCQQAHANGIEVHAWLGGSGTAMYRVSNAWPPRGNATLASHPEWFMVPRANSEGGAPVGYLVNTTTYYALDMGSSDAQEYLVSIIRELVTDYPIDGIHWDDEFDGPTYTTGAAFPAYPVSTYQNSGLARYRRNTGYVGTPAATDSAYNDYRRRFKNEFLARVQAEMQSIKTNPRQPLRHSTAAMTYGTVPSTCDFSGSTAYSYYSDWAGMLQNGWLDTVIPMNYKPEPSTGYRSWCDRAYSCWRYNRDIFMGISGGSNAKSNIVVQMQYAFYTNGFQGSCTYSYAAPCNDGGNWWTYSGGTIFTNTATVPAMPWRNPATASEGIVWGRVRDAATGLNIDDAIVTVGARPAVRTDGNGYFVATMVPATAGGTSYSITLAKTGYLTPTANVVALAGDVVRIDFLVSGALATPGNLAATAINPTQISLAWTDNATNEMGYVIARSADSGGPFVDFATLGANATNYMDGGLAAGATYYYVVRATNGALASANAFPAAATTPATFQPTINSQPQSRTVVVGTNLTFSAVVSGALPLNYQWMFQGAPIPGATTSSYNFASVQFSDGGSYSFTVSNAYGSANSSNSILTVLSGFATLRMSNIWNITANSRPYITSGSTERGLCLNPMTDHVLLVSRSPQLSNNLGIFILDAETGADVGTMDTNGVNNSATFVLNRIDVAEDGAIYGGNLTTASSTSPFVLYRWTNETSAPTVAYSGAPDAGVTGRWGDTMSVTGAGVNTRIIISGSGATNAILFTTTDGTNFGPNKLNPTPSVSAAEFSKGLYLLNDTTMYVKNRSTTTGKIYNYNVASNASSVAMNLTTLDTYLLALAPLTNYHLLAGVSDNNTTNPSGHALRIYDISSPSNALLVTNFSFPAFGSGTNSNNANFGSSLDTDGKRIVALDTQNGIVALEIVTSNPPPHINAFSLLASDQRRFELNVDPGNFVIQASSDFTNWLNLDVTRTNGIFEVIDPITNSPRFYRTKSADEF